MLLTRDAQGSDETGIDAGFAERFAEGLLESRDPDFGVLLAFAGLQSGDHGVGGLAAPDDPPCFEIDDQDLGALRSTVDADRKHGDLFPADQIRRQDFRASR